jgi:holin-like protein
VKGIFGMAVILVFLVAGEGVAALLGLPVPGSVIGMLLLSLALGVKIIPLEGIRDTADFLTGNLSFFFVPVGVGLMAYFDLLRAEWPAVLFATTVSTVIVAAGVGLLHRRLTRRRTGRRLP